MDRATLRRHYVTLACGVGCAAIGLKEAKEYLKSDPGALDNKSMAAFGMLVAVTLLLAKLPRAQKRRSGKPILAVDLDECCCAYLPAFIRYSNATHGTSLELDDFTSYMFWEVPKARLADRQAATERVYAFHASRFFDQIEPYRGAKVALDFLKERFELHVVTSRQTDIEPQTRAFVDMHYPGVFTELHFGNHFGRGGAKISKPEMCKKIGAVALIDDSLDYAKQCAEHDIPVFLFGHYAWNATAEKLSPLITRVHTWRMVAQLVTPELLGVVA